MDGQAGLFRIVRDRDVARLAGGWQVPVYDARLLLVGDFTRMNKLGDGKSLIEMGREALRIEARAVASLVDRLGNDFDKACRMLLACPGRVVVSGMGKSGHVSRKIAATLASKHRHTRLLSPSRRGKPR